MNHRFLAACLTALCLATCNTPQPRAQQSRYRDLKGYFEQELAQLRQSSPRLHKTVSLNNRHDSLTIQAPDSAQLQHLLQPFLEVDLNKPSLQDAYQVVDIPNRFSGARSVMYKARERSTNPREIILEIDSSNQVATVSINRLVRNLVYEYEQHLFYRQGKQIDINTRQKIAFLPPTALDVKVRMEPKL